MPVEPGGRPSLHCTFCHGDFEEEPAYCGTCLAPHHSDCFSEHGSCVALGCTETRVVERRVPRADRRVEVDSGARGLFAAAAIAAFAVFGLGVWWRLEPREAVESSATSSSASGVDPLARGRAATGLASASGWEGGACVMVGRGLAVVPLADGCLLDDLRLTFGLGGAEIQIRATVVACDRARGVALARFEPDLVDGLPEPVRLALFATPEVGTRVWVTRADRSGVGSRRSSILSVATSDWAPEFLTGFEIEGLATAESPTGGEVGGAVLSEAGELLGLRLVDAKGQARVVSAWLLGELVDGEVTELKILASLANGLHLLARGSGASPPAKGVQPKVQEVQVELWAENPLSRVRASLHRSQRGGWEGVIATPVSWESRPISVRVRALRASGSTSAGLRVALGEIEPLTSDGHVRRVFGRRVMSIASPPGSSVLLALLRGAEGLTRLDPTTLQAVDSLSITGDPSSLWCEGGKAYVACRESRRIAVVDLEAWKVVEQWPLPAGMKPAWIQGRGPSGKLLLSGTTPKGEGLLLRIESVDKWSILARRPVAQLQWGLPMTRGRVAVQGAWGTQWWGGRIRCLRGSRVLGVPRWLGRADAGAGPLLLTRDLERVVLSSHGSVFVSDPSLERVSLKLPGEAVAELESGQLITWGPHAGRSGIEVFSCNLETGSRKELLALPSPPPVRPGRRSGRLIPTRFGQPYGPQAKTFVEGAWRLVYYSGEEGGLVSLACRR